MKPAGARPAAASSAIAIAHRVGVARARAGLAGAERPAIGVRREHGCTHGGCASAPSGLSTELVETSRSRSSSRGRRRERTSRSLRPVAARARRSARSFASEPVETRKTRSSGAGQQRREALGEARHRLVEEARVGVQEPQLAHGGRGHARMAVTDRRDVVDAVEVGAPVCVVEVLPQPAHHLRRRVVVVRLRLAGSPRGGARAARSAARSRPARPTQRPGVRAEREPRLGERRRGRARAAPRSAGATCTCRCGGSEPRAVRDVPEQRARGAPRRRRSRRARARPGAPRPRRPRARARARRVRSTRPRERRAHLAAGGREEVEPEVHGRGLGVRELAGRVQARLAVAAERAGGRERSERRGDRQAPSASASLPARGRRRRPAAMPGSGQRPAGTRAASRDASRPQASLNAASAKLRGHRWPPPRRSPSHPRARAGHSRCAARAPPAARCRRRRSRRAPR